MCLASIRPPTGDSYRYHCDPSSPISILEDDELTPADEFSGALRTRSGEAYRCSDGDLSANAGETRDVRLLLYSRGLRDVR